METFSVLLAICAGNSLIPGEFPAQRPVTRSFDVFFDLGLNKRLSKQSGSWWFEMLSCPLWFLRQGCDSVFSGYFVLNGLVLDCSKSINLYLPMQWSYHLKTSICFVFTIFILIGRNSDIRGMMMSQLWKPDCVFKSREKVTGRWGSEGMPSNF